MGDSLAGVALMLLATSLSNVGAVLQKRAVDRLPAFEQQGLRASLRGVLGAPLWLLGWAMGVAGIVSNMVALGLADISLIQPLNGFGLVVLAAVSWAYLGERLDRRGLLGMAAVIGGVVGLGLAARPSRGFATATELLGCYLHLPALATLAGLAAAAVAALALARRQPRHAGPLYALAAATASVVGLTFAKGFFGLLGLLGPWETLRGAAGWLLLLALLAGSVTAMGLQQISFQRGRAVVVTPIFAATSVVLPLLSGWLVFGERLGAASLIAPLAIGLGVVLLGGRAAPAPATAGSDALARHR